MAKQKATEFISERIIKYIEENDVVPWSKRRQSLGLARSYCRGHEYRGINRIILNLMTPYASPYWFTFNDIRNEGLRIKESERRTWYPLLFFKMLKLESDKGEEKLIPMAKRTQIWNAQQLEGIDVDLGFEVQENTPIEYMENIISSWEFGPEVNIDMLNNPCYDFGQDIVYMPDMGLYEDSESFYWTLMHECIHATGHASRLNRKMSTYGMSQESYSLEELTAEIGVQIAAMRFGFERQSDIQNSSEYIRSWLGALKDDPGMIIKAASKAEQAVDYIMEKTGLLEKETESVTL